jgi:hypothetical protein
MYSSKLLNYIEKKYTIIKKKALAMVYALHKLLIRQQVYIFYGSRGFNLFS